MSLMQELLGFPTSGAFQHPVSCPGPNGPIVLSFPIIFDRLRNGYYHSSSEWVNDVTGFLWVMMSLPTSNSRPTRHVVHLAEDYLRRLRKRLVRLQLTTSDGWLKEAERLNLKFGRLFQTAPPPAQMHFPVIPAEPTVTRSLNAAQFEFIVRMCPKVVKPLDVMRLAGILENDPAAGVTGEDGEMKVELAQLAIPTVCQIFDLFKVLFPGERVEMPTLCKGLAAKIPEL
jgi:hypothetical protein